jgi:hypothetical protein
MVHGSRGRSAKVDEAELLIRIVNGHFVSPDIHRLIFTAAPDFNFRKKPRFFCGLVACPYYNVNIQFSK